MILSVSGYTIGTNLSRCVQFTKFSIFREIPRNLVISATNRENQGLPRHRDILHFPRYITISCSFLISNFDGDIDQRSSGPMGINHYKWESVVTNGDQSLQMGINRYKSEDQSL